MAELGSKNPSRTAGPDPVEVAFSKLLSRWRTSSHRESVDSSLLTCLESDAAKTRSLIQEACLDPTKFTYARYVEVRLPGFIQTLLSQSPRLFETVLSDYQTGSQQKVLDYLALNFRNIDPKFDFLILDQLNDHLSRVSATDSITALDIIERTSRLGPAAHRMTPETLRFAACDNRTPEELVICYKALAQFGLPDGEAFIISEAHSLNPSRRAPALHVISELLRQKLSSTGFAERCVEVVEAAINDRSTPSELKENYLSVLKSTPNSSKYIASVIESLTPSRRETSKLWRDLPISFRKLATDDSKTKELHLLLQDPASDSGFRLADLLSHQLGRPKEEPQLRLKAFPGVRDAFIELCARHSDKPLVSANWQRDQRMQVIISANKYLPGRCVVDLLRRLPARWRSELGEWSLTKEGSQLSQAALSVVNPNHPSLQIRDNLAGRHGVVFERLDKARDAETLQYIGEQIWGLIESSRKFSLDKDFDVINRVTHGETRIVLARKGNEFLGAALYNPGALGILIVSPESQGLGIGKNLLQIVLDEARTLGLGKVEFNELADSSAFYRKFAYRNGMRYSPGREGLMGWPSSISWQD